MLIHFSHGLERFIFSDERNEWNSANWAKGETLSRSGLNGIFIHDHLLVGLQVDFLEEK
jgi:hypothetical protein